MSGTHGNSLFPSILRLPSNTGQSLSYSPCPARLSSPPQPHLASTLPHHRVMFCKPQEIPLLIPITKPLLLCAKLHALPTLTFLSSDVRWEPGFAPQSTMPPSLLISYAVCSLPQGSTSIFKWVNRVSLILDSISFKTEAIIHNLSYVSTMVPNHL